MINEINKNIYDYIFSINEDLKIDYVDKIENCYNELDEIIKEQFEQIDFWDENIQNFNKGCVSRISALNPKERRYVYSSFPRMTAITKIEYLKYYAKCIKDSILENGDLVKENIENILQNISLIGKKVILDYCEEKNVLHYNSKVFIGADNHPALAIIYENILPVLEENTNTIPFGNVSIINQSGYGNSIGDIQQSINNFDENKFFEIVEKYIPFIKQEIEDTVENQSKIQVLKEDVKAKKKARIIEILKDLAIGTTSSVISTGILAMFGL